MRSIKVKALVLLVIMIIAFQFYGADENIKFAHIDLEQGLASGVVFCIFQDSKGFLWFGTDYGINRYDGYEFKTYRHLPENPGSLTENIVRTIIEDRSGMLWIGTFGGGLNKFDRKKEIFFHYLAEPGNPNSLSDNFILTIFEDHAGILWIGTLNGGLNRFDPRTQTFTHYKSIPDDPDSLSCNKVRAIYEDQSGTLWLGTHHGGLNKFSPGTGKCKRYTANPADPSRLSDNSISSIIGDKSDNRDILWIGTSSGGLQQFSIKTEKFTSFKADAREPMSLSNNEVNQVYLDRDGILWVGTANGLNRFDEKTGKITRYMADAPAHGSLNVNTILALHEDRTGVLWIGTVFGGINKVDKNKKKFYHYRHLPYDVNSLSSNMVTAIHEDRAGITWIGTYGGLNKWDRKNQRFSVFQNDPHSPTSLSHNQVWCIYEDRSGELWIGTRGGLNRFDRENIKFISYKSDPENPVSLSSNLIMSINEDRQGYLWVGTSNGLNKFDRLNNSFKCYLKDSGPNTDKSAIFISSIFEDRYGVLWIGTLMGLNRLDPERKELSCYRTDPKDPQSLSSNNINTIYEDRSGILWIGTVGGLNRFHRETGTFSQYRTKDGLPCDVVLGILEDEQGNLWLSTNNGLSMFNPQSKKFKNYDAYDGLQSNEFTYACCKSKSGELFFGGINGFNVFFPDQIIDNTYLPNIIITDLKIANKSVPIGEEINGQIVLKNHISETREVQLSYKNNTLSFEYVGLHYAAPLSNRYAYKMEGLEKEWNYVGNRRFAIYPNLKPGHYVFRVKGSNNDDKWNEAGTSIKIYIPPPFWKRWWFRGMLVITFIMLLFSIYWFRTRRLRQKLAEQDQVQKLLKQSRDEMKKSRDIAELRSAENEKLISAISSIFIAVDAEGKISQWNGTAEKFFKIPKAEVKDHSFVNTLTAYIPAEKLHEIITRGLHQDKAVNNIEIPVNFEKNTESKLLMLHINPIIDTNNHNVGFLLLAEDITHEKKEQMRMLLSQKLEALGQMAAGIAHEIRSPLQYIGDNVQFLLEAFESLGESCCEIRNSLKNHQQLTETINIEKLNQRMAESDFDYFLMEIPTALDHIINGVTRVANIVKSMNTFSHMGDEIDERADVNEMLESTLVVAQNRIQKVADLQTDYTPGLPLISCGRGELNQVFLNLLINAADAVTETAKRGIIKISTVQKGKELIIEISDNGTGIPDEIKEKIFTPFFTTKKVGYGTGQGLAFSHNIIVGKYKGKLYYESKVNEGTTFFIHLPIGDEAARVKQDLSA